jgi:hypothetical protein
MRKNSDLTQLGQSVDMDWSRSDTLALATHRCAQCHGSGLRLARKGTLSPCNCVLRTIFKICYDRFLRCATQEKHLSKISLEPALGKQRPGTWGRKDEEYIADFCGIARKTLDEQEHRLFRFYFLLSADWKLCSRRLGMDRSTFFHTIYRVEQKLGRVFRELEPYSLFPLDEYFNGPSRRQANVRAPVLVMPAKPIPQHLMFPKVRDRAA